MDAAAVGADASDDDVAPAPQRHRSREYINLLRKLDAHYSDDSIICLVHTPKHGSWPNLVAMAFATMAHTFLKGIRVASVDKLKRRIQLGIAEMNQVGHVHPWHKFDLEHLFNHDDNSVTHN